MKKQLAHEFMIAELEFLNDPPAPPNDPPIMNDKEKFPKIIHLNYCK